MVQNITQTDLQCVKMITEDEMQHEWYYCMLKTKRVEEFNSLLSLCNNEKYFYLDIEGQTYLDNI